MRAGRPRSQGMGIAAVCAMRMTVSRDHTPSARGVGKPGCPAPRPREGAALEQGDMGKPGFPISPATGGWEGD